MELNHRYLIPGQHSSDQHHEIDPASEIPDTGIKYRRVWLQSFEFRWRLRLVRCSVGRSGAMHRRYYHGYRNSDPWSGRIIAKRREVVRRRRQTVLAVARRWLLLINYTPKWAPRHLVSVRLSSLIQYRQKSPSAPDMASVRFLMVDACVYYRRPREFLESRNRPTRLHRTM